MGIVWKKPSFAEEGLRREEAIVIYEVRGSRASAGAKELSPPPHGSVDGLGPRKWRKFMTACKGSLNGELSCVAIMKGQDLEA